MFTPTSLGLEFLRHGREDDFAFGQSRRSRTCFRRCRTPRRLPASGRLQMVADGFAHPAELLVKAA